MNLDVMVNVPQTIMLAVKAQQLPHENHVWFEDRWMVASLCDE
jgi:hypothetical protein